MRGGPDPITDIDVSTRYLAAMAPRTKGWAARTQRVPHDGDREQELLAAAARVFARQGFGDTRVADIATEAGLSRSGFYVYYESKAEALRAVGKHVRDAYIDAQSIETTGLTNHEVLRRTVLAYLEVAARYGALLGVLEQRAKADDELAALVHEIRHRPTSRSRRFIERAAREDGFELVASSALVADALTGMVERCGALVAKEPDRRDEIARDTVAMGLRLTGVDR